MHWQNHTLKMVRYLINDVDGENYKYSDERINSTVAVASQLVVLEIDFEFPYQIDLDEETITPDPLNDTQFMNLTVLKAACIIIGGEVKTEAANSISIKDGPSAIDLRGVSSTLLVLYKDLCTKYDKLVQDYGFSGRTGQSILGPYSPGADYISRTHTDYDFRGNYFRY